MKKWSSLTSPPLPRASATAVLISHLCVLSMPSSGLSQAIPGLSTPRGPCGIGADHVVGTVPETPLDTVRFIQLIDLGR